MQLILITYAFTKVFSSKQAILGQGLEPRLHFSAQLICMASFLPSAFADESLTF